jgi:hypothetical protein
MKPCPPFMMWYARLRLGGGGLIPQLPPSRWEWLLGRKTLSVPNHVDVRWFSGSGSGRTCAGSLSGRWLIGVQSVDYTAEDFHPDADYDGGTPLPAIVVNFWLVDNDTTCVMQVFDWEGPSWTVECPLPQGLETNRLEINMQDFRLGRPRRNPIDLCLPPGWMPRSAQPEVPPS